MYLVREGDRSMMPLSRPPASGLRWTCVITVPRSTQTKYYETVTLTNQPTYLRTTGHLHTCIVLRTKASWAAAAQRRGGDNAHRSRPSQCILSSAAGCLKSPIACHHR